MNKPLRWEMSEGARDYLSPAIRRLCVGSRRVRVGSLAMVRGIRWEMDE